MTPKEKAEELTVNMFNTRFHNLQMGEQITAKKCALIAVDEIIKTLVSNPYDYGASISFFEQVKHEIKNK